MPIYTVTDPNTNKTLRLEGDSPPTEEELEEIFGREMESDQQKQRAKLDNNRRSKESFGSRYF